MSIDNVPPDHELELAIQNGGRFVQFEYTISIIVMTFRRTSNIKFVAGDSSTVLAGLPYTLLTMVLGWWGIPWGPIYSIGAIVRNFSGGHDLTGRVVYALQHGSNDLHALDG